MSTPPGPPMPPASGQEPDPNAETNPQLPMQPIPPPAGSAPTGASSFWHNDATRVAVIVGGILVGCLLLGGMALTAAVGVGALVNNRDGGPGMHGRMNGNGQGQGQGPNGGRKGRMGQDGQGGQGGLGGMRGGLEGVLGIQHGDVVITGPNGQPETKRVARGAITAVTATALTVKSADGFDSTFTVTPTTAVTGAGSASSVSALAVGQNVLAVGSVAGTTATAERVVVTPN